MVVVRRVLSSNQASDSDTKTSDSEYDSDSEPERMMAGFDFGKGWETKERKFLCMNPKMANRVLNTIRLLLCVAGLGLGLHQSSGHDFDDWFQVLPNFGNAFIFASFLNFVMLSANKRNLVAFLAPLELACQLIWITLIVIINVATIMFGVTNLYVIDILFYLSSVTLNWMIFASLPKVLIAMLDEDFPS